MENASLMESAAGTNLMSSYNSLDASEYFTILFDTRQPSGESLCMCMIGFGNSHTMPALQGYKESGNVKGNQMPTIIDPHKDSYCFSALQHALCGMSMPEGKHFQLPWSLYKLLNSKRL